MIPFQGALSYFLGLYSLLPSSISLFIEVVLAVSLVVGLIRLVLSL